MSLGWGVLVLAAALGAAEPAPARWSSAAQAARLAPGGAGEPFEFAVIGDAEGGRFAWQRLWAPKRAFPRQLAAIAARSPAFLLQLGDFVSRGTERNYRRYLRLLDASAKVPVFHALGNHDRSRPNGRAANKGLYREAFGPADYHFDHRGWRFVALDSSDYRLRPEQLAWLDRTLDTPLRTVLFTHMPPAYLKGLLRSDPAQPPDPTADPPPARAIWNGFFTEGSAEFGRIVAARRPARVYLGHIHAYATAERDGVRYVLSGGGGSPLYPLPGDYPSRRRAHYLLVRAGPEGLSETVHELSGESFPVCFRAPLPEGPAACAR